MFSTASAMLRSKVYRSRSCAHATQLPHIIALASISAGIKKNNRSTLILSLQVLESAIRYPLRTPHRSAKNASRPIRPLSGSSQARSSHSTVQGQRLGAGLGT
ncbi:hypothetical protein TRIP_B50059 [uncultured Desulfatiglans sp.]|uniref:Uncharacterized protein n=1 Tax=Uncultured Desulfatiglans sp. TaxID=1748965 RepID=A0A653AG31_UNCDX|nr:hypothetical protein TRIP_B50059 [uncultured Desulfatiglans sp.]